MPKLATLLTRLQAAFPELRFTPGEQFCWSPESGEVIYRAEASGPEPLWSLLHETGHGLLGHTAYKADFELIRMEMAAWTKARELGQRFGVAIDEDHVQDCLDTYRDWLYKRSICPKCATKCLQQDDYAHYYCFNCHTSWRVSTSRFRRAYRSTHGVRQPAVFRDRA
ncbi:MAG: hypothetical protein JWN38_1274 [Candidatus Saccharibacteria bacterium]|nr:hypothetical protein [Candidatus Saccharibacteria bacterium]